MIVAVTREGGPLGGPVSIKTALFLLLLGRNSEAGVTPPPCPPGKVEWWGLLIPLGRRPTRRKQGRVVRTKRWSFLNGVYSVGMNEEWVWPPT